MSLQGHWPMRMCEPPTGPDRLKHDSAYLACFTRDRRIGARQFVCNALYVADRGAQDSPESAEGHAPGLPGRSRRNGGAYAD